MKRRRWNITVNRLIAMLNIPDLNNTDLKLLLDSVKYKGGIVTGGKCLAGCKYCYLRVSKKMHIPSNIPIISKNDFKKAIFTAEKHKHKLVTLGDGVDLISSEPFMHPLIYEFIEELEASKFIDGIMITTNGLYIKENKYDFLRKCKKIKWSMSCSSLSEEGRKNVILTKNCDRLLDFLSFIHSTTWNSVCTIQLVVYKLKYFIKDIEIINNNFPKFLPLVYIRELAYNKFFSKESKSTIEHCRKEFKKVLEYSSKNNIRFYWNDTNLAEDFDLKCKFNCFRNLLNEFIININKALVRCIEKGFKTPLLCISEACFSVLPKVKDKIILPKLKKGYLRIENRTFGGIYRCYGLLTLDDFSYAFKKIKLKDYDVIILNKIFLNKDQYDLNRKHISQLIQNFELPFIFM